MIKIEMVDKSKYAIYKVEHVVVRGGFAPKTTTSVAFANINTLDEATQLCAFLNYYNAHEPVVYLTMPPELNTKWDSLLISRLLDYNAVSP